MSLLLYFIMISGIDLFHFSHIRPPLNSPLQCYCPGEAILVTADVRNQSARDMSNMHAKLVQTIEFHSSRKTKRVQYERSRLTGPPVLQLEEANWSNQPFGIPALPPSCTKSSVITIQYKVGPKNYIYCAGENIFGC